MSAEKVKYCQRLSEAIEDEAEAAKFYGELIDIATKTIPEYAMTLDTIKEIRRDEASHRCILEALRKRDCLEEPIAQPLREIVSKCERFPKMKVEPVKKFEFPTEV